ncbi:MAG: hypothetical protein C0614_06115 [Desulfuromonas sp.]|nr:MAG: hypothetical protein C0614_06115 [Desulfuromonas sp.]
MNRFLYKYYLAGLLLVLILAGCATTSPPQTDQRVYRDQLIENDVTWSGRILIDGSVKLAKGTTLTIAPGTEVAFVRRDLDADGLGDSTLVVEGRLLAIGTRKEPIRFISAAADPQPGDWLEIRVDFSKDVHLRYCEIRDSAYTLHAHFTRGVVEDCTIRYNIDGCRLGQASFVFRNNLIEHNRGKGINFRNSSVEIHHNIVRYNDSGIFLFENDRPITIQDNNLYSNLDNFRLGDFFTGDVTLNGNWWGTADPLQAQATIYDQARDPAIGKVMIKPRPTWIAATGPQDALELAESWQFTTNGYVDADLVGDADTVFAASWDGHLYALQDDGSLNWQRNLGDSLDATPLVTESLVAVQTWSREVYVLDSANGEVRWRFDYAPSPADDHRQAGIGITGELLLVPAWNGTLYALDLLSGENRWSYSGGMPLRAKPAWDGERIYLASGSGRLSVLTATGELLWEKEFNQPLLSEPALFPGGVAVVTRSGLLTAYAIDGSLLWRHDLAETCYYGAPVYHDQALYVPTAAGALWKFEAQSGRLLWRVDTTGPVYATPLAAEGRIYLGDNSGTLQVFGADSGALLTRFQLEREIQGRPLLKGKSLLFGSRDHRVHALRLVEKAGP